MILLMKRLTPLRHTILSLLKEHHLLSVPQLMKLLAKTDQNVNKTSVYRSLQALQKKGWVCRHAFKMGESVFELRESHHDHLICLSCGEVAATHCQVELPSDVAGFEVDHHHLSFYGTCVTCATHPTSASP